MFMHLAHRWYAFRQKNDASDTVIEDVDDQIIMSPGKVARRSDQVLISRLEVLPLIIYVYGLAEKVKRQPTDLEESSSCDR